MNKKLKGIWLYSNGLKPVLAIGGNFLRFDGVDQFIRGYTGYGYTPRDKECERILADKLMVIW